MSPRLTAKLSLAALLLFATGCPKVVIDPKLPDNPVAVTVQIAPLVASVAPGEHVPFGAAVTGKDTAVTWKVKEANGGQVSANGAYTAPTAAGTYHVVVTSHADATQAATATVTVTQASAPAVTPASVSLLGGDGQDFVLSIGTSVVSAVTWSVDENGGGSVNASGHYVAPVTAGSYHVRGTPTGNANAAATASVTVSATALDSVSPSAASMMAGQTQLFTATVSGNVNTSVSWSVDEVSGGTVTAAGSYTAPNHTGAFHVRATSVADPTQTSAASVSVGTVSISLSPTSATVVQGVHRQFTATVAGAADSSATYSVVEANGGTITAAGNYLAPDHAGTFHVHAVSNADPSAFAESPVKVPEMTITGMKSIRYLHGDSETLVAVDLSKAPIQALQPSATAPTGYTTYPGKGTVSGTFSIPNVPPGPYLLTLNGSTFLRLSTRTPDLGSYGIGRGNVKAADAGTILNLALTNMTPWTEFNDDVQVTSEGAGLGYGSIALGDAAFQADGGVTSLSYAVNYPALTDYLNGGGLIDASLSDVTFVTHLTSLPTTPAFNYGETLKEAFSSATFSLLNGGSATLGGAFNPVTQSTYTGSFPRSSFAGLLGGVNPAAIDYGGSMYLDVQPSSGAHGQISGTPDLLIAYFDPGSTDVALSFPYGNPFPTAWSRFVFAEESTYVHYTVVSGTKSGSRSVFANNWTQDTLAGSQAAGLGPRITPPTAPKLNGGNAYTSPQTGVGAKPSLSWSPPTMGTPTGYEVLIYELKYADTGVTRTVIYSVFGDATFTSLTLPGGLLQSGGSYVARISARATPGVDFNVLPYGTAFPTSGAETLTGMFSP